MEVEPFEQHRAEACRQHLPRQPRQLPDRRKPQVVQRFGVRAAEIWDPGTNDWTVLASNAVRRAYHSVSILMPVGTLLDPQITKNTTYHWRFRYTTQDGTTIWMPGRFQNHFRV